MLLAVAVAVLVLDDLDVLLVDQLADLGDLDDLDPGKRVGTRAIPMENCQLHSFLARIVALIAASIGIRRDSALLVGDLATIAARLATLLSSANLLWLPLLIVLLVPLFLRALLRVIVANYAQSDALIISSTSFLGMRNLRLRKTS